MKRLFNGEAYCPYWLRYTNYVKKITFNLFGIFCVVVLFVCVANSSRSKF
ncbi:MAG: hypothetical protein LBJ00_05910 [Planctomycetaceae bacterium]|nr:hypothetical protein [Planctomycetaceae bacterium]